jgi:hypothetical protein
MECLTCGSKEVDPNQVIYMLNPTMIIRPASYLLCEQHKNVRYDWHDIYDDNGRKEMIDHQAVIERSNKGD